jgi:hypothetical protein
MMESDDVMETPQRDKLGMPLTYVCVVVSYLISDHNCCSGLCNLN